MVIDILNEINDLINTKYDDLMQPYYIRSDHGVLCYEEIEMLETVLLKIKKDLCVDYSEKIFISHREKDKLYDFKNQIVTMFNLNMPDENFWESEKRKFLTRLEKIHSAILEDKQPQNSIEKLPSKC